MTILGQSRHQPVAYKAATILPFHQQQQQQQHRGVKTEAAMRRKGIVLPPFQPAVWSYVKCQRHGNTLHIGDHVGQDSDNVTVRGKVGEGKGLISPEEATELSAQVRLNA